MNYQSVIDKYYPAGTRRRDIYMLHSRQVADKALSIARSKNFSVNLSTVEAAAMLHDIGIFLTDAPSIDCHGAEPYLRHGLLGAELLRSEGVDEEIASVAERHTGVGLTVEDIRERSLPVPEGDYTPRTLLERLICYADKFYSKNADMKEKTLEQVRASMAKLSPESLERFEALHREFS